MGIADIWSAILRDEHAEVGWHRRRIFSESEHNLYAALLQPSSRPGLLLEIPADAVPREFEAPFSRGFEVWVEPVRPGPTGVVRLSLVLSDPVYRTVFSVLCDDVARTVAGANSSRNAVRSWLQRLHTWLAFMRRFDPGGLSEAELVGLIAELEILRMMFLPAIGAADAVDAWQGPSGAAHDFVAVAADLEVKGTLQNPPRRVEISNLLQLEARAGVELFLGVLRLIEDVSGERLPEIVSNLRSTIATAAPHALPDFDDRLLLAGYSDAQADLYDRRFSIQTVTFYEVRTEFPRLIPADIPVGVEGVRYAVDLAAAAPFRVPAEDVSRVIQGAGETVERELKEFLRHLNAEVRDRAVSGSENARPDFKEIVFTEQVGEHLVDVGALEDVDVCYHEARLGAGLIKVDGYSIADDGERLDLLTSHFTDEDDPPSLTTDQVIRLGQRAARLVEAVRHHQHAEMEPASEARGMMDRIEHALPNLSRVRVHVLTNCLAIAKEIAPETVAELPVTFEIWDLERLSRSMASGLPREDIEIDFEAAFGAPIPCVSMPAVDADYQCYLAVIPAGVLVHLYQDYGPRLLEYNVRAFLQATGKVNRGIRDTLRNEPSRFMAYNNGISLTVDALDLGRRNGELVILKARGLQIVNGGQTTASIHRAARRDGVDLSNVCVPAKITVVAHPLVDEIVPRISLYANTQNVVQMADFSANEPFHVQFERLANSIWCPGERGRWFYERARGQYQVARARAATPAQLRRFNEQTPLYRKVTKTDLARYLTAWDQLPQVVNSGAQKNFVRFMRDLRDSKGRDWLPDEIYFRDAIAKAIIFRTAEHLVRRSGLPGYRSQVSTYVVSALSRRTGGRIDFATVWREQSLSSLLEILITSWVQPTADRIVATAGKINVTEWCKKDGCWEAIAALDLPMPETLPSELINVTAANGAATIRMTASAYEELAECKRLTGDDWFAIQAWGQRTGRLPDWQIGIAHTLSGYASGGWRKEPSPKQAKQGVRILAIARDNGLKFGTIEQSSEQTKTEPHRAEPH